MLIDNHNNVNFVVHLINPRNLLDDFEIIDESYRQEYPSRRSIGWCGLQTSSLITRLRYKNKTMRIKQFLYDLGPSSTFGLGGFFDFYPWKIKVVRLNENKPAWFGYDNKGRQALGFLSHLTSIQISAEVHGYEMEDFIDLGKSLDPHPEYANADEPKIFAHSSCWSRFPNAYYDLTTEANYAIPTSLWRNRWPIATKDARVIWYNAMQDEKTGQWQINSTYIKKHHKTIIEIGELLVPSNSPIHQVVYRRQIMPGTLSIKKPRPGKLPLVDAHSGFSGFLINVAHGQFLNYFIASCTKEHGPHDAIAWNNQEECTMIQASSMWGFSITKFVSLLSSMQNENIVLSEEGCLGH